MVAAHRRKDQVVTPAGMESLDVPVANGSLHMALLPAEVARAAVLVVPPFLHEWQRSYRLFALLAKALADRGITVARFDYRGCGDSSGQDQDFLPSRAIDDTHRALDAVAQRCAAPVTLLGVRAGALVAERVAVQRACPWWAWQPVVDGSAYWAELQAHDLRERNNRYRFPFLGRPAVAGMNQIMGHRLHPEFALELAILRITMAPGCRLEAEDRCIAGDLPLPLACSRWVGQIDIEGSLPLAALGLVADGMASRLLETSGAAA